VIEWEPRHGMCLPIMICQSGTPLASAELMISNSNRLDD
jgi:hypothetical protein